MSHGNKRNTRAKPEEAAEKPPEQEDELKLFIQNCVKESQAVLLERIDNIKLQHQEAMDELQIKHAEEIANLKAYFESQIVKQKEQIDILEGDMGKEQTREKISKKN